jgi:glycosyltransferase involved in cell wall biosynthesis
VPLSILSVAYPFAPVTSATVGGAEQILFQLDRALVESGHRSTVIAMQGSRTEGRLLAIAAPVGLIDDSARARVHSDVRQAIEHCIEHERPDLIHAHGMDFAGYLPAQKVPVLVTLHMPLDLYTAGALQPARAGVWLVPVSRSQARTVAPGITLLPPIENGVETPPPARQARRRYLLAMGRICPEKNYTSALDAARLAGLPLLLAGQVYPYREHVNYFETEIKPRLDTERRWIGSVSGALKQQLLGAARCLLVPSQIAETSSLVAMEALAAGTPVIAYRSGALPDVIEHGRTGFIVEDISSMVEAIRTVHEIDPEACRHAARERFPLSRMITKYLALYEQLVSPAGVRVLRRVGELDEPC